MGKGEGGKYEKEKEEVKGRRGYSGIVVMVAECVEMVSSGVPLCHLVKPFPTTVTSNVSCFCPNIMA